MKALRSLETGKKAIADEIEPRRLTQRLVTPHPERLAYVRYAFERGLTVREVARMTGMDPWFLNQMKQITSEIKAMSEVPVEEVTADQLRAAKRMGISDERLASGWGVTPAEVRALRKKLNVMPVYKLVDTCAAEFESFTPYLYSCYDEEDEAAPTNRKKIMVPTTMSKSGWAIIEARDDVKITDVAPIIKSVEGVRSAGDMVQRRWSWPGPNKRPVYNFRSDGREFASNSGRPAIR